MERQREKRILRSSDSTTVGPFRLIFVIQKINCFACTYRISELNWDPVTVIEESAGVIIE